VHTPLGAPGGAAVTGVGTPPQPDTARWGRSVLLFLVPAGFVLGLLSGFLQEHRITIGSIGIPWATFLVIAALIASIRAVSLNTGTRMAGALLYAGWLIATAMLALPNPSGDVVFTNDVGSLSYLLAGSVLGAAAAAWPLFLDLPAEQPQVMPSGEAAVDG
jgi:hypothetical protein